MIARSYTGSGICLKHSEQILRALALDQVGCMVSSWRHVAAVKAAAPGAQIDLLFDRNDDAITLCEIKYGDKLYTLDKATAKTLYQKREIFKQITKTKKQLFIALITVNGLKPGLWNEEVIDDVVKLEQLFR
jgi:uncharacterized protein